jgi:peptidoglycan hydrolase-like protein with peptidoglycan-binding domain
MHRPLKYFIFFIALFITIHFQIYAADLLQIGSKGDLVREVQNYLYQLKYLRNSPTGYYGPMTAEAVQSFQLEYHLNDDGKINQDTLEILQAAFKDRNNTIQYTVVAGDNLPGIAAKFNSSIAGIMVKNNLHDNQITEGQTLLIPTDSYRQIASRGGNRRIQEVLWSIMNKLWSVGEVIKVIDIQSGKSFQAKRYGGVYHADTEPLTKQDTQAMLDIYSGHWSWSRRAVIIECHNLYISASMNGMPHGGETIHNNGFRGQFCIHFLGSRVHQSGKVDTTHQLMVEEALNADLPADESENKVNEPSSNASVSE